LWIRILGASFKFHEISDFVFNGKSLTMIWIYLKVGKTNTNKLVYAVTLFVLKYYKKFHSHLLILYLPGRFIVHIPISIAYFSIG